MQSYWTNVGKEAEFDAARAGRFKKGILDAFDEAVQDEAVCGASFEAVSHLSKSKAAINAPLATEPPSGVRGNEPGWGDDKACGPVHRARDSEASCLLMLTPRTLDK